MDTLRYVRHVIRLRDRALAGRLLALRLADYRWRADVVVVGLARGGLPVAFEIARALHVRLEVCAVEPRPGRERGTRRMPAGVAGKTVIVVDDGLVTGATMRAALELLAPLGPARVVVALPLASHGAALALAARVDELVCLMMPSAVGSVGAFYDEFPEVSDGEVEQLLGAAASPREAAYC